MIDFLVNSLIVSVVLTVLINVLARLFPGTSAEDRIRDMVGEPREFQPDQRAAHEARPPVRIWFPWKQMLLWSMALSIALTVIGLFD